MEVHSSWPETHSSGRSAGSFLTLQRVCKHLLLGRLCSTQASASHESINIWLLSDWPSCSLTAGQRLWPYKSALAPPMDTCVKRIETQQVRACLKQSAPHRARSPAQSRI